MPHDPKAPVGEVDDGTWQLPADPTGHARTGEPTDVRLTAPPDITRLLSDDKDGPGGPDGSRAPSHAGSTEWDETVAPVVEPGRVIFDKYRLIELLGEGGMGQVWHVHNQVLDCKRALKLIWPHIAKNDSGWKRFRREAQLMAKLNHPGAVAVYDFRRTQSMGFIEMEYVRGRSLDKILEERKGQPMPMEWIAAVLDQLCAVLQEAHGHVDEDTGKPKPIIHRDLKPSNLMLVDAPSGRPCIKVLDYGIAKMINEEQTTEVPLTNVGEYLGTVGYSSPEQIRGGMQVDDESGPQDIDGRSDLYSVGVMLYQLLTGSTPFRGSGMAVLAAHLTRMPPPMSEADSDPHVPPEVERVVMRCLEKDPEKRPQTARELAEAFRAALASAPPVPASRPRRRLPAIMGGAAVAAALALGAGWYLGLVPVRAPRFPVTSPDATAGPDTPPPHATGPVVRPSSVLWEPAGYQAVDRAQFVPGVPDEPRRLRRVADGVFFVRSEKGCYLPEGYAALDPADLVGEWPHVIVRTRDAAVDPADRVRFIRIKGKSFLCGDPRPNPIPNCEPHQVTVADFYIQETEVTNDDVEEYLKTYSEDRAELGEWQGIFKMEREKNPKRAGRIAAAGIAYRTARKVAVWFGGRLPTEAEWEFAAKSRTDDYLWPWGTRPANTPLPPARLFDQAAGLGADPVRKFETDHTEQGVYDMAGNVQEWCLDTPADTAKADQDQQCAVRGASFNQNLDDAMVFKRTRLAASEMYDDVGFRVVIECPARPPRPSPSPPGAVR